MSARFGCRTAETTMEALYPAASINDFLLAGIKRVAVGADLKMHIRTKRGSGLDDVAATACCRHFAVSGMYVGLHGRRNKNKGFLGCENKGFLGCAVYQSSRDSV